MCRIGISRKVEKLRFDLDCLRRELEQPLSRRLRDLIGCRKREVEGVQQQYAFRLRSAGFQRQQNKEPNAPEDRDARPSHSRKGRRSKRYATNSLTAKAWPHGPRVAGFQP